MSSSEIGTGKQKAIDGFRTGDKGESAVKKRKVKSCKMHKLALYQR